MQAPNRYALPRQSQAFWNSDIAVVLAVLVIVLGTCLVAMLAAHPPHWSDVLSGRDMIGELPKSVAAPPRPNTIRNGLELLSFAATTIVMITAAAALFFTLSQIKEARDARVASIYMEINSKYNATYLVEARRAVRRLADAHKTDNEGDADFGAYVARRFVVWSHCALETREYTAYSECLRLMQFWEDVGGLVRQTLVEIDIVLDFHVGAVRYAEQVFGPFILDARKAKPDAASSLYANALWLMDEASRFKPFTFP